MKEGFAVLTFLLRSQGWAALSCFPVPKIDIMKTDKKGSFVTRSNLPPHGETTLYQLVTMELGKCTHHLRDSDNSYLGSFTITGTVDDQKAPDISQSNLGTLSMKHILKDLVPSIEFTVTLVGGSAKKYRLKPTVFGTNATDTRLDDRIGTLSLAEIGLLLFNFTFEVDDVTAGTAGAAKTYHFYAQPERRTTPTYQPELYQKNHGDLTLDIIGDVLQYMELFIATVPSNFQNRIPYTLPAAEMTVIVVCNKYRRE